MGIKLVAVSVIFLLCLLTCFYLPLVTGIGKWYYWIEPGVYAKYAFIQKKPSLFNVFYLANGSDRGFTNFTFAWAVIDVQNLYATVDYNLTFYDVKIYTTDYGPFGPYVKLGNMSFTMNLTVRLDTLELVENGVSWGRWPYWIHGWEVGSNITMIRDYLPSPLWPGVSNTSVNVEVFFQPLPLQIPIDVNTSVYYFPSERIFVMGTVPLGQELTPSGTSMHYAVSLEGFYDSVSLIFLDMNGGYFTDDVTYHRLDVWEVHYENGKLVLIDSNVNFEPSKTPVENPALSASLIAAAIIIIALPIVGVFLKIKMKRSG